MKIKVTLFLLLAAFFGTAWADGLPEELQKPTEKMSPEEHRMYLLGLNIGQIKAMGFLCEQKAGVVIAKYKAEMAKIDQAGKDEKYWAEFKLGMDNMYDYVLRASEEGLDLEELKQHCEQANEQLSNS
ncbi:hypothetical protein [Vibrio sp. M260118]|uniref:hypothetical protein n=1 Tax=Vibrio sp. M260118 TaxID=3020896 RepID=UPI002F41EECA